MSISGNGIITASMDSPGLIWTSYNGYFGDSSTTSSSINDNINHFSTASTLTGTNGAYRGTSSDFTSTSTATNGNIVANTIALFSIQFLGYFLAPQTGTYTWSIVCDDKSYLWIGPNAKTGYTINNAIFFDSWAVQSSPVNVVLNAGVYYPIRIQYGEEGGPDSFSLYFTLPGSVTAIYNGAGYYFNDGTLLDNVLLNPSTVVARMTGEKQSNTLIINSLISGKTPWGIYDATLWNSTTNTLPEARSNGRDVTRPAGTVTYGTGSGNGAAASVPYISGITTTTMLWPSGSIPTNFTICSITRYTGGNNGRILTSNTGNWLHGHHNVKRGVAYYNNVTKTSFNTNVGTLNNWLVMSGNNGTSGVSGTNTILVDSVPSGIANGGTGNNQLAINMYDPAELSDWALTYLVIYDTVLTDAEMLTVSNKLLSYLANGTM